MKKDANGKLEWRVVDTTTDTDLTAQFSWKTNDGQEVIIVSTKKFRIDKVGDYEFYVFHALNIASQEFECISTIPSTALRNFLNQLASDEKTDFGLIGLQIEERKIKSEKGIRLFHDFWKAVAGPSLTEKLNKIPHLDCIINTSYEEVDDIDLPF
jgi:hypothetical protein